MSYIENPKTKGSGILCCIPQEGVCPVGCADCFFQSGRSYLEPLTDNLPNMPSKEEARDKIIRVNDGNDSHNNQNKVIWNTSHFRNKFYNTSINKDLARYQAPVVLTLNPGKMTDKKFHEVDPIPKNLMFVRVRTNTWNLDGVVDPAVEYYTSRNIPVMLTFMAYYGEDIPEPHREYHYMQRKRTMNTYNAITTEGWRKVMRRYEDNLLVYSCGKLEGEKGKSSCKYCGNCIREYYACLERMEND